MIVNTGKEEELSNKISTPTKTPSPRDSEARFPVRHPTFPHREMDKGVVVYGYRPIRRDESPPYFL
jgi:hypothetical protein